MTDVNSSGITLCTPHLNLFTLNRPEARTTLHCLYWFGNHTLWLPYLWAMIVSILLYLHLSHWFSVQLGTTFLNMLWLHFFISKLGAILYSWDCYEDTVINVDKQRISWGEWDRYTKSILIIHIMTAHSVFMYTGNTHTGSEWVKFA